MGRPRTGASATPGPRGGLHGHERHQQPDGQRVRARRNRPNAPCWPTAGTGGIGRGLAWQLGDGRAAQGAGSAMARWSSSGRIVTTASGPARPAGGSGRSHDRGTWRVETVTPRNGRRRLAPGRGHGATIGSMARGVVDPTGRPPSTGMAMTRPSTGRSPRPTRVRSREPRWATDGAPTPAGSARRATTRPASAARRPSGRSRAPGLQPPRPSGRPHIWWCGVARKVLQIVPGGNTDRYWCVRNAHRSVAGARSRSPRRLRRALVVAPAA